VNWNIDINIEEPFEGQVAEELLRQVVGRVLQVEEVDITSELSMLIAGDETMRELNLTYRQIDQTTDVLSFAFQEDKDFPSHPEGITQLGEVIISLPQAERQAEEQGHSLEKELAVLTVHGVLHLLGYDHETDEQEAEMSAMEARTLDGPGLI